MLDAGSIIKDLQEMRDEGHLSDALLRRAVRLIEPEERFEWVGIYLLKDEELWLHNYMGEPTDHAKIPVGTGICGRAVAERHRELTACRHIPTIFAVSRRFSIAICCSQANSSAWPLGVSARL